MRTGQLLHDRYRVDAMIASGGMGEVWRGFDTRLGRIVAIKILHDRLANDPILKRRFKVEARSVAMLRSPGVVSMYDYGEDVQDGRVTIYLVMEYVNGIPLSQLIEREGPLRVERMLRIIAEAAEALHAAHHAGIIHRDVKPANILLTKLHHQAKVVDFGIARAGGENGLTSAGMVMGTAAYAAPEQLRGKELSGASDVYALGIVAHECLTGQPPHSGYTVASMLAESTPLTPPQLPRAVPNEVRQVLGRALEPDPDSRWSTAAEFATACRELLEPARPAFVVPGDAADRPTPGAIARRGALITVVAALIALGIVTALLWLPSANASGETEPTAIDGM